MIDYAKAIRAAQDLADVYGRPVAVLNSLLGGFTPRLTPVTASRQANICEVVYPPSREV